LPQSLIKHISPINKLRVYFTGNDLWETSKNRDGWDPEQKRQAYSDAEENVLYRYPFCRSYTIGIDVSF
jgi:hypothetical protein